MVLEFEKSWQDRSTRIEISQFLQHYKTSELFRRKLENSSRENDIGSREVSQLDPTLVMYEFNVCLKLCWRAVKSFRKIFSRLSNSVKNFTCGYSRKSEKILMHKCMHVTGSDLSFNSFSKCSNLAHVGIRYELRTRRRNDICVALISHQESRMCAFRFFIVLGIFYAVALMMLIRLSVPLISEGEHQKHDNNFQHWNATATSNRSP